MKILIVHPQMALYAGAEIVVVRLAHYLQQYRHKVSILTLSVAKHSDYEGLDFILPKESERMQYRLRGSLGAVWDILRMYRTLSKLCKEHANDFDVINVHNFPAIWAVPNKKRIVWMCNEIPELWHAPGVSSWLNQLLNAGRLIDRLIARGKHPTAIVPDHHCAQRFQHRYGLHPESIPYGIDGKFFSQGVRSPHNRFTVIQPSMVSPSKMQMEVLKATRGLDVKVIYAGYYEPRHPYTAELIRSSTGLDVTFTGHVSREKLRDLYHTSHVAVFPGKGQGSWLGPFEALATGTPVIVSPNLSCSAVIAEQSIGTVADDITGASQAIRKDYPKYQQQALKGREFVLRELTWDKFGEKMLELMK